MQVNHDKKLLIATGRSRKATQWQNREMLWSEFLEKLARPTRTRETVAEYAVPAVMVRVAVPTERPSTLGVFTRTTLGLLLLQETGLPTAPP